MVNISNIQREVRESEKVPRHIISYSVIDNIYHLLLT